MKPLCMCLVYFSKTFKNIESSLWCFVPFLRAAAVDECDCDKLDFAAARAQNKEGLDQFVQDRTVIAALNDRLVRLIELVRTNTVTAASLLVSSVYTSRYLNLRPLGSLFWGRQWVSWMSDHWVGGRAEQSPGLFQHHLHCGGARPQSGRCGGKTGQAEGRCCWVCLLHISPCDGMPKWGFLISVRKHVSRHDISRITLCIIVGRSDLQPCQDPSVSGCFSPQDEILNDTQELQKELKLLKKDYEKASQQRIFVRQEQQDVAEVIVFGIWQVFCWYAWKSHCCFRKMVRRELCSARQIKNNLCFFSFLRTINLFEDLVITVGSVPKS